MFSTTTISFFSRLSLCLVLLAAAIQVPITHGSTTAQTTHQLFLPILDTPALPPLQAGPLSGRWIWQGDSDGTTPTPGSECALVFITHGPATLNCFQPSQEVSDSGTYAVAERDSNGGTISLDLPGVGINFATQVYQLRDATLTLPFTLINGVPGTSTWRFDPLILANPDDPAAVAFFTYEQAILAGASEERAAEDAAAALRERSFPTLSGGNALAAAPLSSVTLNTNKTAIKFKRENGRSYNILLNPKAPSDYRFVPAAEVEPLSPGFFAGDPRTHLYMEPGDGLNDPVDYTAALLFPVHSQVHMRVGRFFSFKGLGEDPEILRKQLLRAGYRAEDITVKIDSTLSPKTLADILLTNPGVVYLSTHGVSFPADDDGPASFQLLTGSKVEIRDGESPAQALTRAVLALGLPEYLVEHVGGSYIQTGRLQESLFMSVGNSFFDSLRANNPGWNMARSFVYLDACESAKLEPNETQPAAMRMFRAAVTLGWSNSPDPVVGVHYSQHLFRNLVRKTHSVRETWDHLWRVLKSRQIVYEEDKGLDSSDSLVRRALAKEIDNFHAYGADGKPYHRLGDGMYERTTPDGVFWLVWLGRWSTDPETAANNLQSCWENVWSKGIKGLGAGPLCNAGYRGTHTPTANEVKEARQLLVGLPLPVPGDRWTLADMRPYASPVGGPFD